MKESKPWGFYRIIEESDNFKIKYLYVDAGEKLSLQTHEHRAEHWVIIHGKPFVTVGDFQFNMNPGQSITVEIGQEHRVEAPEDDYVEFIEVQTGKFFDEDDIKRIKDEYGRK